MAIAPTKWNPLDKDDPTVSLYNGDLSALSEGGSVRSIYGATSGKYYWEVSLNSQASQVIGIATEAFPIDTWPGNGPPLHSCGFGSDGILYANGAAVAQVPNWSGCQTLSVLLDVGAKSVTFWVNGNALSGLLTANLSAATGTTFYAAFGGFGSITANFGATPFAYTPQAGYASGFGADASSIFPQGVKSIGAGTPLLFSGQPQTLTPSGAMVLASGAPTALPYAVRDTYPYGPSLLQAGVPLLLYDPIIAGNSIVQPSGSNLAKCGTPAALSGAAMQVAGTPLLSSGIPSVGSVIRNVGASSIAAGIPSVSSTANPVGLAALRAGMPMLSGGFTLQGLAAFKAGAPRVLGTAAVIAPGGLTMFSVGIPSTHTALRPWGKTHCRSGVATAVQEDEC